MGDAIGKDSLAITNHMVSRDVVGISKQHSIVVFVEDADENCGGTSSEISQPQATFVASLVSIP